VSWEQIQTTVVGLIVSAIVTILGRWAGVKVTTEQQKQATWALEQGVAYAALRLQNAAGPQKKDAALSVAASIAPNAIGKLNEEQKSAMVEATYARLKPSLPGSVFSMRGDNIPVDIVETAAVRPLPAPSRVPK
jgi:hypothetical protein